MITEQSDRELLELAAKAAGYKVVWNEQWQAYQHTSPKPDRDGQFRHVWVPLEDDGDVLRLAVKLHLQVTPGTYGNQDATAYRSGVEAREFVHYQQDLLAATRRAIVRAAAEIGKQQ